MARLSFLPATLVFLTVLLGLVGADATACNPLNVTTACAPIPGLATSTYFLDFTTQSTTPGDWILADYATVNYASPDGANFTITKRQEAPYIWSRFYVLFGHIEVVAKVAKGAGIITGAVMMSDDLDEIDWEFSGNNFGRNSGQVLTNYFGKGQIGWSDRGAYPAVDSPQDKYHTYALDWQSDRLVWSIDGVTVRTLNNNGATTGSYQYPQTPSRLHLGMWCAGDPASAQGTVNWAGGYTDFSQAPFTAFVKSVKITTPNTCNSWQYPYPFDGTSKSVQCSNQTVTLPCTYTVVTGDDGNKIASKLTVNADSLKVANPGVDWDKLLLGQVLNVPGGTCTTSSTTTSMPSTTSISVSTTTVSTTSSSSSMSPTSSSSTSSSSSQPLSSTSSSTSSTSSTTTSSTTTSSSTVSDTTTSSSALTPSTATTITSLTSTAPAISASGSSSATSSAAAQSYTVVAGDVAWQIAEKNGCSFDALSAVNPGINWDNLQIGQAINVPSQNSSSSSASTFSGSSSSSSSGSLSTSASSTSTDSSTSTSTPSSTELSLSSSGASASVTDSAAASTTSSVSSSAPPSPGSGSGSTGVSSTVTLSPNGTPGTSTSTSTSSEAVSSSLKAPSTATTTSAITFSSNANAVNPITPSAKMLCNQDNCLRNLIDPRYSSSMREFCSKYTTKTSNETPLPTFLGGCATDVKRVSSACSCLITSFGPTGTSSTSVVTASAFRSGAPLGRRVPSWLLKRSPLRWNRAAA